MKLLKTPFYIVILLSTILLGACGGESGAEPTAGNSEIAGIAVNSEIVDTVEIELVEAVDMLDVLLEMNDGETEDPYAYMMHYLVTARVINNSEQDIFIQGDGRLEYFDGSEWIPIPAGFPFSMFHPLDGQLIPPNEEEVPSGAFGMPEGVGVDDLFRVIQRVNTTATFEEDGQHDLVLEFQIDGVFIGQ